MNTFPQSTALLTDMYELTMIESALQDAHAHRNCVFELFARRLPGHRRYGVVAGIGRALEALTNFTFGQRELTYLLDANVISQKTANYLRDWKFSGSIYGYAEGECYFPHSPILTVTGSFVDGVILETLLLSILNYDSAVATAASRMTIAAHDRPCLDMGSRRTHEVAAIAAARACIIGGFIGTSNLEACRRYGIQPIGTAAHSFTLLHENEAAAFDSQISTMGTDTTLLVDTYDVQKGVQNAVAAARRAGGEVGAIRLDSGDLVAQAFQVRKQLDELGATQTKITVTNDLDEYAIAALNAAPVDSYGVGTKVVTGSGRPTAEMVYKLVAREGADGKMHQVAKKSAAKKSIGGLKVAGRTYDGTGRALAEIVVSADTREQGLAYLAAQNARPLQVELVKDGIINETYAGAGALAAAASLHRNSRAALPYSAWRLSEGDPGIPTEMIDIFAADDV
ncbi:nicotinate phosphoribosyltransferase [Arcanobacterium hippocoleae]|uniref:Nicotinate phosphoribosyltransferase n=1 Tax=Arcanobacterium hippocoleae TaxID=149017 RepID=A0ABU1SZT0_9ACTO|nr:nicotinate phosphoribosyltransferase [Arcanobacterium hippocoleae]MDR6938554.1 nicotinate phosphoribosyltransferase [Arcanobacterium hippocoleae]